MISANGNKINKAVHSEIMRTHSGNRTVVLGQAFPLLEKVMEGKAEFKANLRRASFVTW